MIIFSITCNKNLPFKILLVICLKYYRNGLKREVLNKSISLDYKDIANTFFMESIYSSLSAVKA